MASMLVAATTNGVLKPLRYSKLSCVCGWKPSLMSITKIAISAAEPHLLLRVVKASWQGVSIKSKPGIVILVPIFLNSSQQTFFIFSIVMKLVPICFVMPRDSHFCTTLPPILPNKVVFPWSTCAIIAIFRSFVIKGIS